MSEVDIDYDTRIDCEVVDYQLAHSDPTLYNNHVFTIKVWIQKHMYAIERSYTAFCDLDTRLRKQYARSNIPPLKLAGAVTASSTSVKLISSTSNLRESRKSVHFPPDSEADRNELKMVKRVESSEVISQKKKYLTGYLQALLKIPEVVLSDILLYFLDEESIHGEPVADTVDEQSDSKEIHLILQGLEMTTKMVRADRQQEVYVPPNHFVVWSFNTLNHDVGFSVTYKDKEIIKYQRYDSHHKLIMGHFAMPEAGTVKFIWDNSYSRWRSKTVNYVIKVVCQEEYDAARATAVQLKKDHLLFLKQRAMVKSALIALSGSILSSRGNIIAATAIPAATAPLLSASTSSPSLSQGVNGPFALEGLSGKAQEIRRTNSTKDVINNNLHNTSESSVSASLSRSNTSTTNGTTGSSYWEFADMAEAMREVNRLRNEKKTLQQALGESETALVTERNIAAQFIAQFDTCSAKNVHLENELNELKVEFDLFRENYFNEMESKLAETLATFELQHSNGSLSGSQHGGELKLSDEKYDKHGKIDSDKGEDVSRASTTENQYSTAEGLYNELYPNETQSIAVDSERSNAVYYNKPSPSEVSLNQLLNFTTTDLQSLDADTLVAYYNKLNTYTQSMLKNGYLTKDMESAQGKLKHEKKQLKTYAIQMKQSLDSLSTRYIHLDLDRAELLNQVRELKDLVVLLETDRRGLKEHIAALTSIDPLGPAPSEANDCVATPSACTTFVKTDAATVSSEVEERDNSASARLPSATTSTEAPSHPGSSIPHFPPATPFSSTSSANNKDPDTYSTIGLWLNSGLTSASTAVRSFEGFDFVKQTISSSGKKDKAEGKSAGDFLQQDIAGDVNCNSSGDSTATITETSNTTSTIVISVADLQQAQHPASIPASTASATDKPSSPALSDTGSDCRHSFTKDDANEVESNVEDAVSRRKSHPVGTLNALSCESSAVDDSSGDASIMDDNDINSPDKAGATNTDSAIHKVTEQLYGILPTWGQLAKVTKF